MSEHPERKARRQAVRKPRFLAGDQASQYPLPGDAWDMDKEMAEEEENNKEQKAQEKFDNNAFTVIAMVAVFFLILVILMVASGA